MDDLEIEGIYEITSHVPSARVREVIDSLQSMDLSAVYDMKGREFYDSTRFRFDKIGWREKERVLSRLAGLGLPFWCSPILN